MPVRIDTSSPLQVILAPGYSIVSRLAESQALWQLSFAASLEMND